MPLADISFGEGLLFIFEFFLLFAWIWILISIIGDLFRDHELSGVAKAVWVSSWSSCRSSGCCSI